MRSSIGHNHRGCNGGVASNISDGKACRLGAVSRLLENPLESASEQSHITYQDHAETFLYLSLSVNLYIDFKGMVLVSGFKCRVISLNYSDLKSSSLCNAKMRGQRKILNNSEKIGIIRDNLHLCETNRILTR